MVAALCSPFPTLVDVAWVFRDLGREREFREAVLDADPIKSPWNDAARAICDGDIARAADIIDRIGEEPVRDLAGFRTAMGKVKGGAVVLRVLYQSANGRAPRIAHPNASAHPTGTSRSATHVSTSAAGEASEMAATTTAIDSGRVNTHAPVRYRASHAGNPARGSATHAA